MKSLGGTNSCIIYCRPLRITKTKLTGCLSKTDQNQNLNLRPQRHTLFYKVFFDKTQSKLPSPSQISMAGTIQVPPGILFLFIPPFQNIRLNVVTLNKKEGDTVK